MLVRHDGLTWRVLVDKRKGNCLSGSAALWTLKVTTYGTSWDIFRRLLNTEDTLLKSRDPFARAQKHFGCLQQICDHLELIYSIIVKCHLVVMWDSFTRYIACILHLLADFYGGSLARLRICAPLRPIKWFIKPHKSLAAFYCSVLVIILNMVYNVLPSQALALHAKCVLSRSRTIRDEVMSVWSRVWGTEIAWVGTKDKIVRRRRTLGSVEEKHALLAFKEVMSQMDTCRLESGFTLSQTSAVCQTRCI